jgi:hypothetical protein
LYIYDFFLATSVTATPFTIVYSQNFTNGATPTTQCTAWTSFVGQLTNVSYTLLRISGTLDSVGVTLTDPAIISSISLALRTSVAYGPITSNGYSWSVGICGGGYELSAGASICICTSSAYSLRPCLGNSNYGGVNSTTCGGLTQTMTVTFQV